MKHNQNITIRMLRPAPTDNLYLLNSCTKTRRKFVAKTGRSIWEHKLMIPHKIVAKTRRSIWEHKLLIPHEIVTKTGRSIWEHKLMIPHQIVAQMLRPYKN
ncbi:hypothetical protein [Floridanema aerugineum]|uniref:Uncharacterized protein n=1 Tax=Floridaenema aerugineum BLCC-F46 TaxID=3153654 RepID=A0ABV4X905_9CYAN